MIATARPGVNRNIGNCLKTKPNWAAFPLDTTGGV